MSASRKGKGRGRGKMRDESSFQGEFYQPQKFQGQQRQAPQNKQEIRNGHCIQLAETNHSSSEKASKGSGREKRKDESSLQGEFSQPQKLQVQQRHAPQNTQEVRNGPCIQIAEMNHSSGKALKECNRQNGPRYLPSSQNSQFPEHRQENGQEQLLQSPQPINATSGKVSKGRGRGRGKSSSSQSEKLLTVGRPSSSSSENSQEENLNPDFATTVQSTDTSCRSKTVSKSSDIVNDTTVSSLEPKSSVNKVFAKRPDYGKAGTKISVFANYFKLTFKDSKIYHYDIDISEVSRNNKIKGSLMSQGRTAKQDARKGVKNVERQERRNIGKARCRQIISEMIQCKSFQKYYPVYDGQKNLFTNQPLPFTDQSCFPVNLTVEGRIKQFYVTIQPAKKVDGTNIISLQPLKDMYAGRSDEIPEEVMLVYETVLNHRDPPLNQVQYGNAFFSFSQQSISRLGFGLEVWFGHSQSVHLSELGPVVVINLAAKAFHRPGPVIEYAEEILRTNINEQTRLANWQTSTLTRNLRGLKVRVTHQKQPRTYKVRSVTSESARELTFGAGNNRKSISQYFWETYQMRLQYPNLPCLHMQSSNNTTFIPMETCTIIEGQPKIEQLRAEETSKMIQQTTVEPQQRFNQIGHIAQDVRNVSQNKLGAYGLLMNVDLIKVNARIIPAPQLQYGQQSKGLDPDAKGIWRLEDGRHFYNVVKIKNWCVISFADSRSTGNQALFNFCKCLKISASKCGIQMDQQKSVQVYGRNKSAKDVILEAKESGAEIAIIVLNKGDSRNIYAEVKFLADFKYNLVTQCIDAKTLNRVNPQIASNLCLKINVKLGGINHILYHNRMIFPQNVMVIGIDVIHFNNGYPSIVAAVTSLDPTASRYALICRTQENKKKEKMSQETLRDMKGIAKYLIQKYMAEAGVPFPHKIIVFRDGVSQGQFQKTIDDEVSGIQEACKELFDGTIIPMTFIVAQKRIQTRFHSEKYDKVAGLVVDTGIVHPRQWDFFICSHVAIRGTRRPVRYIVLHDDNKFTSDTLQQLCHFLCFTYVRCTRSVSLPSPILYADLAAERAKKYADFHILNDLSSRSSNDSYAKSFPREVYDVIESMQSFENNMFYV